MAGFTEQELGMRIELVKPIVEAAFSIRGRTLAPEDLAKHSKHWEAAFSNIGTPQLRELYRIGLARQCKTAEEFISIWEMKVEAEFRAKEHAKTLARRDEPQPVSTGIPAHILADWTAKGVKAKAH